MLKRGGKIVLSIVLATILVSALLLTFANDESEAKNREIAADLAVMCQVLSEKDIYEIYMSVGDMQMVTRNIFLYDSIAGICAEMKLEWSEVLKVSANRDLFDVLELLELAKERSASPEELLKVLEEFCAGETIYDVMAGMPNAYEVAYANYRELSKEELRALLKNGYSGEDIVVADELAREMDITLQDALARKQSITTDGTELLEAEEVLSVTVVVDGEEIIYSAESQAALSRVVQDAYEQAEIDKLEALEKAGVDTEKYTDMGYLPEEIETAKRLADQNGTSIEDIVGLKESGEDWAEIIKDVGK